MVALILVVAVGDIAAGSEVSFAIFYLLPVSYATWFIGPRAGMFAAVVSAICWYLVEVAQHGPYSYPLIPLWNAAVRLVFFAMGVALVRSIKRTESRLLREVSRRTRTLRAESERRRRLERELLEVSAKEQMRMTQDLHDGLGQYLSALAFHARVLADDLQEEKSPRVAQAERFVELVRTMNQTLRRIDRAIRVPQPEDGGLPEAIRSLTSGFEHLTGVRCVVDIVEPLPAMDHFRVIMLFRIVQEALNNAVKHGKPTTVQITARVDGDLLCLRIIDDGRGMAGSIPLEPGAGMRIMALRAELIGGKLSVLPNPTGGCIAECLVAISGAAADRLRSS